MASESGVVITGLAWSARSGLGTSPTGTRWTSQRSGVGVAASHGRCGPAGVHWRCDHGFDGKQYVKPRKALKVMCREIQTGFSAAGMAVEQARAGSGTSWLPSGWVSSLAAKCSTANRTKCWTCMPRCIETG